MADSKSPLRKIGTIGVGIFAVLLVVHGYFLWHSGAQLEKRLTAIRDSGAPLTLADLAPKPVPAEKNAATFLHRARKGLEGMDNEYASTNESFWSASPTKEDLELMRSMLAAYPDAIPLVMKAAECPEFAPQWDYTVDNDTFLKEFLDGVQWRRRAARAMNVHVSVLRADGKQEEALNACISMLKLVRHFDREPLAVGYLVSLACRGVAVGMAAEVVNDALNGSPLPEAAYKRLETELALHDDMAGYLWALKSERAFVNGTYRSQTSNWRWLVGWYFKYDQCDALDGFAGQLKLGTASAYEISNEIAELKKQAEGYRHMARLLIPSLEACREATYRVRASIRCLRVLNALAARGNPEKAEIANLGLPEKMTLDPYDGKPLRLKKTDKGWMVYSIGANRKDDGGKLDTYEDVGVGR